MKIICFGNLNIDISLYCDRTPEDHEKVRSNKTSITYGGAASNTAFWLSKFGRKVYMIGCCGTDDFGNKYMQELFRNTIDANYVQRSLSNETNLTVILVTPGSKRMISSGGANKDLDVESIPNDIFNTNTHLHISYSDTSKVKKVMRTAKNLGAVISVEIKEDYDPSIFELANYCFINEDDFSRWFGMEDKVDTWNRIKGNSSAALVITLGENGAMVISEGNEIIRENSFPTAVVDRTGGGDAFDAGFINSILANTSIRRSLVSGLQLASKVVAWEGAQPKEIDL